MLKKIIVGQKENIQRVENYLLKIFKNLSRSQIFKLIRLKKIKVNNIKIKNGFKIQSGDMIEIWFPNEIYFQLNTKSNLDFLNTKKRLSIVYEDDNVLIIDKPANISCQSDNKNKDSIQNLLLKYMHETNQWDKNNAFIPSICNRLDTNTTGLVLAAKNGKALDELNSIIKYRHISKYYDCLVFGILKNKIATKIAFLCKDKNKNLVKITSNKINNNYSKIITKYKVIKEFKNKNFSLLEVELITGKTHQIRAHFNYLKHPVVGDHKYGLSNYHDLNKNYLYQALHAKKIMFKNLDNKKYPVLQYLDGKIFTSNIKPWFINEIINNI